MAWRLQQGRMSQWGKADQTKRRGDKHNLLDKYMHCLWPRDKTNPRDTARAHADRPKDGPYDPGMHEKHADSLPNGAYLPSAHTIGSA